MVYSGLADATRSLLIQAVDPAGNVDVQAQPITWTVDTTPPDTVLANPGNIVGSLDPAFTFTATEAGSTFQCSFNNAPFAACTSPDLVDVLALGAAEVQRPRRRRGGQRRSDAGRVHLDERPDPAEAAEGDDLRGAEQGEGQQRRAGGQGRCPTRASELTFTNPLAKLLGTPTFTLSTRLQAQWKSDSSAVSYDVTVSTLPEDSTGYGRARRQRARRSSSTPGRSGPR